MKGLQIILEGNENSRVAISESNLDQLHCWLACFSTLLLVTLLHPVSSLQLKVSQLFIANNKTQ